MKLLFLYLTGIITAVIHPHIQQQVPPAPVAVLQPQTTQTTQTTQTVQPIVKPAAPHVTVVDPQIKIERCKANADVQSQNAMENYLPPQSSCGDDLECTTSFLQTWSAELQYIKRTAYESSYADCLDKQ